MISPRQIIAAAILALMVSLPAACHEPSYNEGPSGLRPLGHMSPIEMALTDKKWVPWGLTEGALKPGDILKARDSFRRIWDGRSCVEKGHNLPLEEPGQPVTIDTLSVSADQLSGGIGYLGLAQDDLEGKHVSFAKIQFRDLAPKQILVGPLNELVANSKRCSGTLTESGMVHVSEVLYGRLDITFYTRNSTGGLLNVTATVFNSVGARIEGATLSQDGQTIMTSIRPLGFRDKGHSSEEVLSWIGVTHQGAIEEEVKRSFTDYIKSDLEAEKVRPKLIKALHDDRHAFTQDIVEIWIGEDNFHISRYDGFSLGADLRPLYLTGFSMSDGSRHRIFDEMENNPLAREVPVKEVQGFEPFKVESVPVGQQFHLTKLSWHKNAYCQNDRMFDFFMLANITRFQQLRGVNLVFIIAKNRVRAMQSDPIQLVDVKVNSSNGRFESYQATDFVIEDLDTHGQRHGEFFLKPAVSVLSQAFPDASQTLNDLSLDKVSIYQMKLRGTSHPYALALRCPQTVK